jgi:short-subunit dehydrogenase
LISYRLMKIALITGASEGIGSAIAEKLITNDFHIIALARSRAKLEKLYQTLNSNRLKIMTCDIRNREQIDDVLKIIRTTYPHMDVLINNAGVGYFEPILNTPFDHWQETMDVNVTGAFLMTQASYPLLKKSDRPHIFNICSTASRKGFTNCGAYSASKFGLLGFTEVLREEFRPLGVKVTAVIPGAVDTSFWNKADASFDRNKMLNPCAVADAIFQIYLQDPQTVTEEIIIKPTHGDF